MKLDIAALRALADDVDATPSWLYPGKAIVPTDTLRALCDAADEVERLRQVAADNWRSWEREATEHARTLALIGAPMTGEPLSEGEQGRFEAAVERGLRKRAEDERDAALAEVGRLTGEVRAITASYKQQKHSAMVARDRDEKRARQRDNAIERGDRMKAQRDAYRAEVIRLTSAEETTD